MTAKLVQNTISEYHQKDDYISKSMLADILDCPFKYNYHHNLGNKKESKDHLNVGNAVHTLALEPELFKSSYYILPLNSKGKTFVRNEAHKEYQEQIEIAGDRLIITKDDFENIERMSDALTNDPTSKIILSGNGKIETSIYWEEENGLKFKCRPDWLRDDGIIVDLKTARDVRPHKFKWHCREFAYDISVALTCRGYKALTGKMPENYIFLLVGNQEPNIVQAYETFRTADDSFQSVLEKGEERLELAIEELLACREAKTWNKYFEGIVPLSVV